MNKSRGKLSSSLLVTSRLGLHRRLVALHLRLSCAVIHDWGTAVFRKKKFGEFCVSFRRIAQLTAANYR